MWQVYLVFLLVFYILARNRLEIWFPLVILRSKRFTNEIYEFGAKNSWVLRKLFSMGILLGLLMMVYSFYYLGEGVIRLPVETNSRLGLLIPGTEVAGIKFPLVQGIIAVSLVVAIHEFGHGIASASEGIKPKSTAIVFLFGLIPGGGVELDDRKIRKVSFNSRMRIMCAGSLMNVFLAIVILLANRPLIEFGKGYLALDGIRIVELEQGSPVYGVLQNGMIIREINGVPINSLESLTKMQKVINPKSQTFIETDQGMFVLITDAEGKIGFSAIPEYKMTETVESQTIFWLSDLFGWIFLASLGLAVANMMPLWPFDGGYVIKDVLDKLNISRLLKPVYSVTLALVLINIFSPWIRGFIRVA